LHQAVREGSKPRDSDDDAVRKNEVAHIYAANRERDCERKVSCGERDVSARYQSLVGVNEDEALATDRQA